MTGFNVLLKCFPCCWRNGNVSWPNTWYVCTYICIELKQLFDIHSVTYVNIKRVFGCTVNDFSAIGCIGSSSTDVHSAMVFVFIYISTMLGYRLAHLWPLVTGRSISVCVCVCVSVCLIVSIHRKEIIWC